MSGDWHFLAHPAAGRRRCPVFPAQCRLAFQSVYSFSWQLGDVGWTSCVVWTLSQVVPILTGQEDPLGFLGAKAKTNPLVFWSLPVFN